MYRGLPATGLAGQDDDASCPGQGRVAGAAVPRLDDMPGPSLPSRIGGSGLSGTVTVNFPDVPDEVATLFRDDNNASFAGI